MTNRGTFTGTAEPQTQYYRPTIVCAANSGTPTNPDLTTVDGTQYQFGRYIEVAPNLIYAEIQCQFLGANGGSTGGVGSGGVYCFSLPPEFPLLRPVPGQAHRVSMGVGQAYLSFANPTWNVDAIPTPADPWTTLNGTEDQYFQAFIPYNLDEGSGATVTVGNQTVIVNHKIGYAWSAYDATIVSTGDATTGGVIWPGVGAVTTTQFTVQTSRPVATADATFAWRIRAEPQTGAAGAVLSPTTPWDWATKVTTLTPFGNLFFMLLYEPQR